MGVLESFLKFCKVLYCLDIISLLLLISLQNYKHPLLKNGIIPSDRVEAIFYKLDDILDCHLMFRVGLHERIKNWDEHEQLGDDFTGVEYATF